jgi:uncharacterized protein YcnI
MNFSLRVGAVLGAAAIAMVAASSAFAHAEISPAVSLSKSTELFSLAVPTEKEGLRTTKVEMTLPAGFGIDSFVPAVGWKRAVQSTGSGEETQIQKVTWTGGGGVPTEEDALFQFLGTPDQSKKYTFSVRQTYSDGSVVDWSGPESSDAPAPVIEAKSSLGGGGSTALALIALIVGVAALLLGFVALFVRGGRPAA